MVERWGTLSVRDHLDAQGLIADILVYDRLVFPVMSGPGERVRWRENDWHPDKQEVVIEELGDLAVRAAWDDQRQQQFKDLRKASGKIAKDAFQTTRWVLAMNRELPLPPGVTDVRAVAAYHDTDEGETDLMLAPLGPDEEALGKLAFVVSQRLLVPLLEPGADLKEAINRAKDLSLTPAYREQRSAFFEWQETTVDAIARGRRSFAGAVAEIEGFASDLNKQVHSRWKRLVIRSVLTIVGVTLPFALGLEKLALLTSIPGVFELVKFGAVEAREGAPGGKAEAAAMVVSAMKALR